MSGSPVILAMALCILAGTADGRTWRIAPDPNHPENLIAGIVEQASSGDTLLIDPGTYYEHIYTGAKELTFIGAQGPEATILDGSRPFTGNGGSILYSVGHPGPLHVEGLTLQDGQGLDYQGGAVYYWDGADAVGSLYFKDCFFIGNDVSAMNGGEGGAIWAYGTPVVRIESCVFRDNVADGNGAALYVIGPSTDLDIISCEIDQGPMERGYAGVFAFPCHGVRVLDSTVTSHLNYHLGIGVYLCARAVELARNRFEENGAGYDMTLVFIAGCELDPSDHTLILEDNVLWNQFASLGDGSQPMLGVSFIIGSASIQRNTFAGGRLDCELGGPLRFERNIVTPRGALLDGLSGSVSCNDVWPDSMQIFGGDLAVQNNIRRDPLFCELDRGDLHIAHQSPCAAGHSPPACGQIGALGEACDVTVGACCLPGPACVLTTAESCAGEGGTYMGDGVPCDPNPCVPIAVESVTWGRIKAIFR